MRLLAAVVAAVAVAAVVTVVGQSRPDRYEARATITIDQPLAVAASTDEGAVRKLQALLLRYGGLVATAVVMEPTADAVGASPEAVRRAVFVEPRAQAMILVVGASTGSAERSERFAQAAAEEVVDLAARDQQRADVPPEQRFTLTVVDDADDAERTGPDLDRSLASGAVAGVIALAAVLLLLYVVDVVGRGRRASERG